jgi:hypothetical protein
MEHQRTERIPFGSNGVGFDEKGFGTEERDILYSSCQENIS